MTDTVIKYGDIGLPAFETGGFKSREFISGPGPEQDAENYDVDPAILVNGPLPFLSVVGLNSEGLLTLATQDKEVQAIGITTAPVDQGLSAANVGIWRDGTFNPSALNFDASYDTDAKKKAAFEGAPTPTVIFVKKPLYE